MRPLTGLQRAAWLAVAAIHTKEAQTDVAMLSEERFRSAYHRPTTPENGPGRRKRSAGQHWRQPTRHRRIVRSRHRPRRWPPRHEVKSRPNSVSSWRKTEKRPLSVTAMGAQQTLKRRFWGNGPLPPFNPLAASPTCTAIPPLSTR